MPFAAMTVVFLDATDRRELTLSSCDGLQGDRIHPCADGQHLLHLVIDGKEPLQVMHRLQWMDVGDAGHLCDGFVDSRVVLHRARTERIESRVDPEVAPR